MRRGLKRRKFQTMPPGPVWSLYRYIIFKLIIVLKKENILLIHSVKIITFIMVLFSNNAKFSKVSADITKLKEYLMEHAKLLVILMHSIQFEFVVKWGTEMP